PGGKNRFAKRLSIDPTLSRRGEAWNNLHPDIRERVLQLLDGGVGQALERAIVDSLAEVDGVQEGRIKIGLMTGFLLSALIDADRTDTANFENPASKDLRNRGQYTSWDSLIDRLETRLAQLSSDRPIDELRREVSENCKRAALQSRGLYRLT